MKQIISHLKLVKFSIKRKDWRQALRRVKKLFQVISLTTANSYRASKYRFKVQEALLKQRARMDKLINNKLWEE